MSISSTLSSALSGLTASARAADVVSSNLANAMTEGYAVRRLDLAARQTGNDGAGVQIIGVTRQEDAILIGQRRLATADLGANQTSSDFMTRLEAMLGAPDDPGSLSARMADFEAKLTEAANSPWNNTKLTDAVEGASAITDALNDLSNGIQDERKRADASIGVAVDQINGALEGLAELNARILSVGFSGGDVAALVDAQNQLVDQVAPYIPLQTRRDNNGLLNVYSDDGQVLVNYRAAQLEFTTKPAMDPYQSIENGTLSGLTLDGRALQMDGEYPAFSGGELRALFDVRDSQAPAAQSRLDGIALDLAERFDAAGLDPSIVAGSPGLFTDAGVLVDGSNELGLASRLRVNAAVVPSDGGSVWRLRDGLGAAAEGPTGNAAFLTSQINVLADTQTTSSSAFSSAQRTMSDLISENLSIVGMGRATADMSLSRSSAQNTALKTAELAGGVDSDAELQRLLQIEQMYAANARVINVAGQMMDELLRIAG